MSMTPEERRNLEERKAAGQAFFDCPQNLWCHMEGSYKRECGCLRDCQRVGRR